MERTITDEKLEHYFDITGRALKKVKKVDEGRVDFKKAAEDFLEREFENEELLAEEDEE